MNKIEEILAYMIRMEFKCVAMKYLEKPLLLLNRKFDIRQWVLVTHSNPLTIWYYDDCYLRFASKPFNLKEIQDR